MFNVPRTIGTFSLNTRKVLVVAHKMLTHMHLSLEGKWAYNPYHVISNHRVKNGYSAFVHESRPEMEKLQNGGNNYVSEKMEVENPHPIEKGLKIGR